MNEAILTRAQKLYGEAREIVAEEVKLQLNSSRHIVRLASIRAGLYEFFLGKHPGESLVLVLNGKAFANFRECMIELLRPLDLGERSGWYYLSIGRYLLGKIPESELDAMLSLLKTPPETNNISGALQVLCVRLHRDQLSRLQLVVSHPKQG